MQRALDLASPRLSARAIEDQISQFRSLEERFTLPTAYLEAIDRIRDSLLKSPALDSLALLATRQSEFFGKLQERQTELLNARFSEINELARRSMERIVESLIPVEALLDSMQMSEAVLDAALLPSSAYQAFADIQIELASSATSRIETANRLLFVDAAGELLEEMSKGIEFAVLIAKDLATTEIPVDWEVNLYAGLARKAEEVDFEAEGFEAEELVEGSCEAGVAHLGQRLVRLIYDLNTEAEREGKLPVFKPTTKSLYACMLISTQVATEDDSFHRIVDQLYFLLYEGSADAKRLIETWSAERLDALWRLKHLRLGARHDIDHGKRREIEGKTESIAEAFRKLIGSVIPKVRADWCRAQLALYNQLVEMLEHLWFNDAQEVDDSEPPAGADDTGASRLGRRSAGKR